MRTTLDLDPDIAALLEKVRKAKGLSLEQIVNEALRAGLSEMATTGQQPGQRSQSFQTRHADLGRYLITSLAWTMFGRRLLPAMGKPSNDSGRPEGAALKLKGPAGTARIRSEPPDWIASAFLG